MQAANSSQEMKCNETKGETIPQQPARNEMQCNEGRNNSATTVIKTKTLPAATGHSLNAQATEQCGQVHLPASLYGCQRVVRLLAAKQGQRHKVLLETTNTKGMRRIQQEPKL